MILSLIKELKTAENKEKAQFLKRFFKTAEGEYGFGDEFLGITVPEQRKVALKYTNLNINDLEKLLKSKIHEERLIALFILIKQFQTIPDIQPTIFDFYIKNAKHVNNWDLVDASADKVVGEYLVDKKRDILLTLAKSDNLWEKRISIVSTYAFIKRGESEWTFKIAAILQNDSHDLIHKAVGWMLREVGKRSSENVLKEYLNKRYKTLPRTTLRYAIERFPADERKRYLQGLI